MFRKLIILGVLLLLLAAAAGLIAQERRDGPVARTGPQERQLRAQNQLPPRFCPQCQCPRCQKIREGRMQQIRQRRRGAVEGMDRPFMAPGGPQRRFGGPQMPRDLQPQVGPRIRPQFGPQAGPQMPVINEWFEQLKQAYRENDKEKMGQLIRKMEQLRNKARQALPQQTPEGIRAPREGWPDIERPLPQPQLDRAPLRQQQERIRQRERGFQQDFEVPAVRPDRGPWEQDNVPVSPERQMRLRQGWNPEGDRPPGEQPGPAAQDLPNPERSDFPLY